MSHNDVLANKGTRYELLGDGTVTATQTYSANAKDTTLRTTTTHEWWDSAKQTSITLQARNSQVDSWKKVWRPGLSQFAYDVNGHSKLAYDEEGKRAFSYWTDADGQVLKRQELIGGSYEAASGKMNGASKSREHSYYYLDGKRIGDVGNDQTERTDYAQELAALRNPDSKRSYERFTPTNAADFDANFQPINSEYPAGTPSSYTVRQGDTLQGVARILWGDATLWYLLAEANGLVNQQPGAPLTANTIIMVPNQVTNIHNTSSTFKPYNPGKALGDTSPTLPSAPPPPPPPSKGGCGGIGTILTIVVIIAATVFTAGAAAVAMGAAASTMGTMAAGMAALSGSLGMAGIAAAAVGAAAGSIAGQGFGIATGQQEKFSWKQVGLSALGGAVSAGVGSVLQSSSTMAQVFGQATEASRIMGQAAVASTFSQGLMTATGLQHSLDWRGVAAAAAAAGVGYAVGKAANSLMNYNPQAGFDWSRQFASNTVSGIAAGTAYGAVTGRPANATQLIAGSAVSGAMGATAMESQLRAAQQQAQQAALEHAMNSGGISEASYWNQSRTVADRYVDVYGGDVVPTGAVTGRSNRDAEMRRLTEQARSFQYQQGAPRDLGEIRGVGDIFDLNQYHRIGTTEEGRPLLQMPTITVTAERGDIRALSDSEAFFAFNPLGRGLVGAWDGIKNMGNGAKDMVMAAGDAMRYPTEALANRILPAALHRQGDFLPYSDLGRTAQQQGLAATSTELAASMLRGTAQTVAAPFRAAYLQNDAREMGRSLAEALPVAAGMSRVVKFGGNGLAVGANRVGAFADEAKLISHFEKHGAEFGAKSSSEYLQIGQDIMQYGQKVEYLYKGETRTGFVQFMNNTSKGDARFGLVGTNSDGAITTIFAPSGKNFWKAINGSGTDKTIRTFP